MKRTGARPLPGPGRWRRPAHRRPSLTPRALGLRPAPPPSGEAGFLLPLSFGAALVLMLSSLSVQTAALQGTALTAAELRARQLEDTLASAAQQVAGQLSGAHGCLLALDIQAWPAAGCGPGAELVALREGTVGSTAYRVTSWQTAPGVPAAGPGPLGSGELELELVESASRGPQRRYALTVAAMATAPGPQPQSLRLHVVGVRGMGR